MINFPMDNVSNNRRLLDCKDRGMKLPSPLRPPQPNMVIPRNGCFPAVPAPLHHVIRVACLYSTPALHQLMPIKSMYWGLEQIGIRYNYIFSRWFLNLSIMTGFQAPLNWCWLEYKRKERRSTIVNAPLCMSRLPANFLQPVLFMDCNWFRNWRKNPHKSP